PNWRGPLAVRSTPASLAGGSVCIKKDDSDGAYRANPPVSEWDDTALWHHGVSPSPFVITPDADLCLPTPPPGLCLSAFSCCSRTTCRGGGRCSRSGGVRLQCDDSAQGGDYGTSR